MMWRVLLGLAMVLWFDASWGAHVAYADPGLRMVIHGPTPQLEADSVSVYYINTDPSQRAKGATFYIAKTGVVITRRGFTCSGCSWWGRWSPSLYEAAWFSFALHWNTSDDLVSGDWICTISGLPFWQPHWVFPGHEREDRRVPGFFYGVTTGLAGSDPLTWTWYGLDNGLSLFTEIEGVVTKVYPDDSTGVIATPATWSIVKRIYR